VFCLIVIPFLLYSSVVLYLAIIVLLLVVVILWSLCDVVVIVYWLLLLDVVGWVDYVGNMIKIADLNFWFWCVGRGVLRFWEG